MNSFSIKFEVRSCNSYLLHEGKHTKAEIIKWNDSEKPFSPEICFVLAVVYPNSEEDFELRFVGDRPLEY